MNKDTIAAAEAAARKFIAYAERWRAAQGKYESHGNTYPVETPIQGGALRRASMELTRALADMRRPI